MSLEVVVVEQPGEIAVVEVVEAFGFKGDKGDPGSVVGPAAANADRIAVFADASRQVLKDGGVTLAEALAQPKPISQITGLQGSLDAKADKATQVATAAGSGLAGGGDLTGSRSLAVDIAGLAEDAAPDFGADFVMTRDVSASERRKATLRNIGGQLRLVGTWDFSAAVAAVDFTGLQDYRFLLIVLELSHNSGSSQTFTLSVSSDNGAAWTTLAASLCTAVTAATTVKGWVHLTDFNDAAQRSVSFGLVNANASQDRAAAAAAYNAVRIAPAAGSLDAGYVKIYGSK